MLRQRPAASSGAPVFGLPPAAELALARDKDMVPILGTPARKHLEENVAAPENELTPDELAPIDEVPPKGAASGLRCPEEMMKMVGL